MDSKKYFDKQLQSYDKVVLTKKIVAILETTGALKRGHFKLSSGLHSDKYIQCALMLQYPEYAEFLGKELAKKVIKNIKKIDRVVSPAVGGLIIGHEVARALKIEEGLEVRAIFAERVMGRFVLRRGFDINQGEKILIVEDVITTGKSSLEVENMIESMGASVAGYAAICDRRSVSNKKRFKRALYSLLSIPIKNYKPERCPLCLKNLPLYTPGSKFKAG